MRDLIIWKVKGVGDDGTGKVVLRLTAVKWSMLRGQKWSTGGIVNGTGYLVIGIKEGCDKCDMEEWFCFGIVRFTRCPGFEGYGGH